MWDKVVQGLAGYESAVLTGLDAAGDPASIRCYPEPDQSSRTVRIRVPAELAIAPGPVALLCHSHDDELWSLRSFVVRGELASEGDHWIVRPTRIVGDDATGPVALIRQVIGVRKTAQRYLQQRGLPTPTVPWDRLKAVRERARQLRRAEGKS